MFDSNNDSEPAGKENVAVNERETTTTTAKYETTKKTIVSETKGGEKRKI